VIIGVSSSRTAHEVRARRTMPNGSDTKLPIARKPARAGGGLLAGDAVAVAVEGGAVAGLAAAQRCGAGLVGFGAGGEDQLTVPVVPDPAAVAKPAAGGAPSGTTPAGAAAVGSSSFGQEARTRTMAPFSAWVTHRS
jgi:hypothetical protein